MSVLYLVTTSIGNDGGDDFIIEKLHSNKIEAYKHKFKLMFDYNTTEYPEVNNEDFNNIYKEAIINLNENNLKEYDLKIHKATDNFLLINKSATKVPYSYSNVTEMKVDCDKCRTEYLFS